MMPPTTPSGSRRASLGAERVPSLKRYRVRELLDSGLERIRDSPEKPPALARDHARPSGKCFSRGVDRTRDILDAAARDLGDRPAMRWIFDLKHLARRALDPLPADQHERFFKRRRVTARLRDSRHDRLVAPHRGLGTAKCDATPPSGGIKSRRKSPRNVWNRGRR
jgi:hypothetical protein